MPTNYLGFISPDENNIIKPIDKMRINPEKKLLYTVSGYAKLFSSWSYGVGNLPLF